MLFQGFELTPFEVPVQLVAVTVGQLPVDTPVEDQSKEGLSSFDRMFQLVIPLATGSETIAVRAPT